MSGLLPATALPGTVRQAFRDEIGRIFAWPPALPAWIALNALLMVGAWWLLPTALTSLLFDIHRTWAFPSALAAWMLSDVVATNVFAADRLRMAAALDDPVVLRRLLYAKDLVLWTVVAGPCALIGLAFAEFSAPDVRFGRGVLIVVIMPFASLGVASWLGAVLPYHPIPLRERWLRRRELGWRNIRWVVLTTVPYGLIGPLTALALVPTLVLWISLGHGTFRRPPQGWTFYLGAAFAVVIAVCLWVIGNEITVRIASRRRIRLVAYLSNPSLG